MSYRKIEVDGTVFEYSIGKTHTKIRHVGAFLNTEIGHYRSQPDHLWWDGSDVTFQVRPTDLANFIRRNRLKVNENKRRKT